MNALVSKVTGTTDSPLYMLEWTDSNGIECSTEVSLRDTACAVRVGDTVTYDDDTNLWVKVEAAPLTLSAAALVPGDLVMHCGRVHAVHAVEPSRFGRPVLYVTLVSASPGTIVELMVRTDSRFTLAPTGTL